LRPRSRLHGFHRVGRVESVAVRPDVAGVLLRHGGPADHRPDRTEEPLILEERDHLLHHRHRRGQERRHADHVRAGLAGGVHELPGRDVLPEVDHLEPRAGEHDADEVLADVVEVALDRADDDLPAGVYVGLAEVRFEDREPGVHRLGREEHLRKEDLMHAESLSHHLHARDQSLFEDRRGLERLIERRLRQGANLLVFSTLKLSGDRGQDLHRHLLPGLVS